MMKPKEVKTKNPLFIFVEGEGMCEEGMLEIQQQDGFMDEEWNKIRIPYEDVPLLIKALNQKIPELNSSNYEKWDKEVFNRTA